MKTDKEAQQKIAHILGMRYGDPLSDNVAKYILQELRELGYRKLPKEKPGLRNGEETGD